MSFFGATAFQCVNPKVWVMVLNTALLFMPREGKLPAAFGLAFAGAVVGLPCIAIWAWSGEKLRYWLQKKWALNAFNLCMAMLLAATALWLLMDELKRGISD
jgi:threonine/homoserine/homoserine lactone efflux protein